MNTKKLKELRRACGKTQRQVSIECDITQETVYALENGRSGNPTLETLKRLAECYGVGIADLLDEQGKENA